MTGGSERSVAMAGVFDIDLDQPEENVSDDENEEVQEREMLSGAARVVTAESLGARRLAVSLLGCVPATAGLLLQLSGLVKQRRHGLMLAHHRSAGSGRDGAVTCSDIV